MDATLFNHKEIYEHLYCGEIESALDLFLSKTNDISFTSAMRNTFLSSLNYGLYNYILLKDSISLHKCCLQNEKLISQTTNETLRHTGISIITSYQYNSDHLIEKYSNVHVRNALYHIHQNLNSHLTLENISTAINVNPSYLCQLFKKELQISFTEYILNKRILLAKSLLKNQNFSIQDIASQCGFKSVSYFSTCYKKITGKSPSEDRQ